MHLQHDVIHQLMPRLFMCCLAAAWGLLVGCGGVAETTSEPIDPRASDATSTASVTTFPLALPAKAVGTTALAELPDSVVGTTSGVVTTASSSTIAIDTPTPPTTAPPATTTAPTTTTASTTTEDATSSLPAVDAATAYLRRCGGCHGAEGSEQGAQTLAGIGAKPESFVREKVMTGGGGMPAFGEWLEQAEIDAIIMYVRSSF